MAKPGVSLCGWRSGGRQRNGWGMRGGGLMEMLGTWGTPGSGNRGSGGDVGDTRW